MHADTLTVLSADAFTTLTHTQSLNLRWQMLDDGASLFDVWRRWRAERPNNLSRLHLVIHAPKAIPSDALSTDPQYAELRTLLLRQYPPAIHGVHRLIFAAERLTLDLWFGDDMGGKTSQPTADAAPTRSFAVIGAGIAGLSMAHALAMRGHEVTLIEQEAPLAGGSGNPRALLLSKLPKASRVQYNLQTTGGLSTARWWQDWSDNVVTATGALLQANDDDIDQAVGYPVDLVERLNPAEVQERAGMTSLTDQLYLPRAAIVDPAALRDHVLRSSRITLLSAHVSRLAQTERTSWQLYDTHDELISSASHVIVACAKDSPRLCPTLPTLTVIRGQMAWCAAPETPKIALGYGGYAVRFEETLLLGSSFVRDDVATDIRLAEHQAIYDLIHTAYPNYAEALPAVRTWQGRASLRALPRDSMPLVGAVPDMAGVYTLTGMGSKGFSFAPLCAEWLASSLLDEPSPLPDQLAQQISPSRFIKKERVRKPYYTPPC